MSEYSIRAEGLSKSYLIAHQRGRHTMGGHYRTLREDLLSLARRPFSRSGRGQSRELFWALRDVCFEVRRGEVFGIIGRNGAGKSTLLKILSRITEPSGGSAEVRGRVGSLLEVGTGFHQELTGRENIFLNGAILGMTRQEVQKKFDAIVSFAEVESFLDTPVKRYSSGMYVRLAFAVAAHLEPEILIIDEVLAVGDAQFQKKCLAKMRDARTTGRTVLLVSHNMSAISSLCDTALLLVEGTVAALGPASEVIRKYSVQPEALELFDGIRVEASCAGRTEAAGAWEKGETLEVSIAWAKDRFAPGWQCDLACYTMDGTKLWALESERLAGFSSARPGDNRITFRIVNPGFAANPLRLDVGIRRGPRESYSVLLENCLSVTPGAAALPGHRREDVAIVPDAACEVSALE